MTISRLQQLCQEVSADQGPTQGPQGQTCATCMPPESHEDDDQYGHGKKCRNFVEYVH